MAEQLVPGSVEERDFLLDHIEAARVAIAQAQHWAERWRDHAFKKRDELAVMTAQRDALRSACRDIASRTALAELDLDCANDITALIEVRRIAESAMRAAEGN